MPEPAATRPAEATNEALLVIEGIHCSACTQLIEARLHALGGVEHVSVSLMTHRARVRFRAQEAELNAILAEVTHAGYRAWPIGAASVGTRATRARRVALWRLFVAGFAMMQVMMYAFPAYIAIPGEMDADIDALLRYASLILCIPVLLYSASPLLRGAWRDLRNGRIGMDVPVALGILVTFCGSTWNTLAGGGAVFFDSLAMFVFVLLGGRYLEMLARQRASAAIEELTRLQPARAERLVDFPASLRTESIDAQALAAGDLVLVRAGEAVPADGEVLRGESHCDEALLTGESRPVPKQTGASLIGGALNLEQALCMRVTRAVGESRIAGIVRLMEEAAAEKPGLVQLADRYAGHFLWGVLLLAAAAWVYWAQSDPLKGIWVAITILVVTCPCALALAAPVALSASIGHLARRGLLVTSGRALEALSHATDFVFDKTGTLTTGRMQLLDITLLGPPGRMADSDAVLRLAARLEEGAVHPVARAICMHAAALPAIPPHAASSITQLREMVGQGVEAQVDGMPYRIGRADFALALSGLHASSIPANSQGRTQVLLADAQGPLAALSFGDGIRPGAAELIASLRRAGRRTLLLSGDDAQTAARIGGALGLDEVHAGMTPDAKRAFIAALQARGARVAMVGDGINDAPALALADVSIAMGSGAPLSQARADMVLMSPRPDEIAGALDVARRCHAIVRENLAWAALYNLIAIPLAACGWLTPWMAAIGMSASSLLVVLNSLRLTRDAGQGARIPTPAAMLPQTRAA